MVSRRASNVIKKNSMKISLKCFFKVIVLSWHINIHFFIMLYCSRRQNEFSNVSKR